MCCGVRCGCYFRSRVNILHNIRKFSGILFLAGFVPCCSFGSSPGRPEQPVTGATFLFETNLVFGLSPSWEFRWEGRRVPVKGQRS